jgi:hypothetical protein
LEDKRGSNEVRKTREKDLAQSTERREKREERREKREERRRKKERTRTFHGFGKHGVGGFGADAIAARFAR